MRKNWWNKDRLGSMLFLLAFLGLSWWFNYPETFAEPPQSVHTWRQTNSLSITQMYFQYNVPFFHPEIHNQISAQGLSGNSAGEFPIIYYLTAQSFTDYFVGAYRNVWVYDLRPYLLK